MSAVNNNYAPRLLYCNKIGALNIRPNTSLLFQFFYHFSDISVDADRAIGDLFERDRLAVVDAGEGRVRVLRRHIPERNLDDTGRVVTDAEFKLVSDPEGVSKFDVIVERRPIKSNPFLELMHFDRFDFLIK